MLPICNPLLIFVIQTRLYLILFFQLPYTLHVFYAQLSVCAYCHRDASRAMHDAEPATSYKWPGGHLHVVPRVWTARKRRGPAKRRSKKGTLFRFFQCPGTVRDHPIVFTYTTSILYKALFYSCSVSLF